MSKGDEYQSKYYNANNELVAERKRKYRRDNKDKIRQYLQANKDKINEQKRRRYHANKDKIREQRIRSRANKGIMIDGKRETYKPPQKTIDMCCSIMELCGLKGRVT